MATYSFKDCNAAIEGPGGAIPLGNGSGVAEEGITIEATGDKNTMVIGADGNGMHNLIAGEPSTVTVRLLKTSPINALLQQMYNYQTSSSVLHGKNTIAITDLGRGDLIMLTQVAFKKRPTITFAKEGGMNEWAFDAISTDQVLGTGVPSLN